MDLNEWQKINSFALWISSFGSIFAAVVALYLAKRSEKERILLRDTWVLDTSEYMYGVRITNTGNLPLYIERVTIVYTTNSEFGESHLATKQSKLEYGQTQICDTKVGYKNIPKYLVVETSSGKKFKLKPSSRFKKGLRLKRENKL